MCTIQTSSVCHNVFADFFQRFNRIILQAGALYLYLSLFYKHGSGDIVINGGLLGTGRIDTLDDLTAAGVNDPHGTRTARHTPKRGAHICTVCNVCCVPTRTWCQMLIIPLIYVSPRFGFSCSRLIEFSVNFGVEIYGRCRICNMEIVFIEAYSSRNCGIHCTYTWINLKRLKKSFPVKHALQIL